MGLARKKFDLNYNTTIINTPPFQFAGSGMGSTGKMSEVYGGAIALAFL